MGFRVFGVFWGDFGVLVFMWDLGLSWGFSGTCGYFGFSVVLLRFWRGLDVFGAFGCFDAVWYLTVFCLGCCRVSWVVWGVGCFRVLWGLRFLFRYAGLLVAGIPVCEGVC